MDEKINSISDEDDDDFEYYIDMSSQERLEIAQFLREQYLQWIELS